jgi:hypothetical protein
MVPRLGFGGHCVAGFILSESCGLVKEVVRGSEVRVSMATGQFVASVR